MKEYANSETVKCELEFSSIASDYL